MFGGGWISRDVSVTVCEFYNVIVHMEYWLGIAYSGKSRGLSFDSRFKLKLVFLNISGLDFLVGNCVQDKSIRYSFHLLKCIE